VKVLLLTNYFPPEIGAASHLFHDLARALVEHGHQVTVVTGFPRYNVENAAIRGRYRGKLIVRENLDDIVILRVPIIPFVPRNFLVRKAEYFFVLPALFIGALLAGSHDVVLVYSPPVPVGMSACFLRWTYGTPFVFNIQDIHPQALVDLGFLKNRLLIWILEAMERRIYRTATYITVHSEGNRDYLISRRGAHPDKVIVIPNWVDTNLIRPSHRDNSFRKEYGLGERFVVSFAGTMGTSQDLGTIIQGANLLRGHEDIIFALVGDGVEKPASQQEARRLGLNNVKFIPMQPRERYPDVLAASDISLVTLKKNVVTPVVPSKILSIMAAGRPLVASLPLSGDAPRLIAEARCGLCVPPEDPQALAQAILTLHHDPALREEMGRNGRRYAEEYLSLRVCAARYEELLRRVAERGT